MYTLKLKKGMSCTFGALKATKANPLVKTDDEELALKAIASGRFSLYAKTEAEPVEADVDVEKMTVAECKAYAAQEGIDISGLTKVADLRAAILSATEEPSLEIDMDEE